MERYAKDISKKVKSALRTKAMNGGYCMGAAPYGYKRAEGSTNRLVPDENADKVRLVCAFNKCEIEYDFYYFLDSEITKKG